MDGEKDETTAKDVSQEGLLQDEPVGTGNEAEAKTNDVGPFISDDDDLDGARQVPGQGSSGSSSSQNGDMRLSHGFHAEEWPSEKRKHTSESELSIYLTNENQELNLSKTGKVTKDHTLVESKAGKRAAATTPERSLPVSLKLQKKSSSDEINNNVDDIQPQFKELSLHSPTSHSHTKNGKPENIPGAKHIRFYVEASCITGAGQPELLNISCEAMGAPRSSLTAEQEQEADSSGNLADVSKTISSLSGSPMTYVPPPPTHLARMSYVSSNSSGSSFPTSAATMSQKAAKNLLKFEGLTQSRINYLTRKWRNSNLVYGILDYIDKVMFEDKSTDYQISISRANYAERKTQAALDSVSEESPIASRKRVRSPERSTVGINKRSKSSPFEDLLGTEVFAKWQNRKYYFAHVTDILDENHLQVAFLDTTIRTVTKDQIITELDSLIGNKIMVTDEVDGEQYYPGIVTSFFVDDGVFKYSVLTDTGDFEASVAQIYFTEHQAKAIKQGLHTITHSNSDVSGSSALYPGCSGLQRELVDTTASETEGSPSKVSSDSDLHRHIMGCDIETNDPQNLNPSVKLKNVLGKLPKRSNKNEDSLLGPLKFRGTWFKGSYFLITCSTRAVSTATTEYAQTETDSEDYPFTSIPFVYDRLVQQIKLGGGEFFEKFEDIYPSKYVDTYLITNRPCLTPKYLKCLTAGIKIVCHEWVVVCTIKQKLMPMMDLPAGWSMEKNKFINMFDRKSAHPLSGFRIKLAQHQDQYFVKFWSHICNAVGATASRFTGSCDNTTVIIAESGLKDVKLDKAKAFGVPVVSTSWIIQSVLHGEVRPYDGHPSYNHLFEENEYF